MVDLIGILNITINVSNKIVFVAAQFVCTQRNLLVDIEPSRNSD